MSAINPISGFEPEGTEECLRVIRLALPALAELGPVTWQAGFQVMDYNWQPWLSETFSRQLLPLLGEARTLAANGMAREMIELDQVALQDLSAASFASSKRAGRILLRHGVPTGAKVLQKLAVAVQQHQAAGHLATVFAARCSVFSISPRLMALSYLYVEVRLGAPDWHDGRIFARVEEARPIIEDWLSDGSSAGIFSTERLHG